MCTARATAPDLVVGYNINGFDYRVLQAHTDQDLQLLPTFDLMYDLESRLVAHEVGNEDCHAAARNIRRRWRRGVGYSA